MWTGTRVAVHLVHAAPPVKAFGCGRKKALVVFLPAIFAVIVGLAVANWFLFLGPVRDRYHPAHTSAAAQLIIATFQFRFTVTTRETCVRMKSAVIV